MLGTSIFSYAKQCPKTRFVNFTTPLTLDDKAAYRRARVHCKEIWADAPCLKQLEKRESLVYWATCGK